MVDTIETIRNYEEETNAENLNPNNIFGISVGDDILMRIAVVIPETPITLLRKVKKGRQ